MDDEEDVLNYSFNFEVGFTFPTVFGGVDATATMV
jgi:hypothetical protein